MIPLMGERHFNYDAAGTRLHPMDEDLSLGTPECIAKGSLTSFSCNFATNGFAATTSWVLGPGPSSNSEQVTEYAVTGAPGSYTSTWQHSTGVPTDRSSSVGWSTGVPTDRSSSVGCRNVFAAGGIPGSPARDFGSLGWKLLATYHDTNTYFALNDWLGTKRVELGANGCRQTYTSLAFGNGLASAGNCAIDGRWPGHEIAENPLWPIHPQFYRG